MEKLGILSKHITLCEASRPIYGIILIQGGIIQDIFMFENEAAASQVLNKLTMWNIIDYSDYYISPGIIDLNVRKEWESYGTLTKAAISGGTTFILEEPSFFNNSSDPDELYCDIATVKILSDANLSTPDTGYVAYKAYLFQPAASIPAISDIDQIIELSANNHMPLLIDPNLPDPRMLFMASPNRLNLTEEREQCDVAQVIKAFAASYPHDVQLSESDESEESDAEIRTVSLLEHEIDAFKPKTSFKPEEYQLDRFSKDVKIILRPSDADIIEAKPIKRRNSRKHHTILTNLTERINEDKKNIEILCQAENSTYQNSGATKFIEPVQEEEKIKTRRRPKALSTALPKAEIQPDYTYFLANCPESWEIQGIRHILPKLSKATKIHFQNVSSSSAINMIREASETYKNVTCEISSPHLYFNSGTIGKHNTRFKACPPIRSPSNFTLLWELLKVKGIHSISSQHALIDYEQKAIESCSFQNALNGICSIENTMLSVWSSINIPTMKIEQSDHYIVRLSKWFSLHPAKVLGLNNRGSINKGKYADLIVWNPYCIEDTVICSEHQKLSPFFEHKLHGKIHKVYIKGELAYDNGLYYPKGKKIINLNS